MIIEIKQRRDVISGAPESVAAMGKIKHVRICMLETLGDYRTATKAWLNSRVLTGKTLRDEAVSIAYATLALHEDVLLGMHDDIGAPFQQAEPVRSVIDETKDKEADFTVYELDDSFLFRMFQCDAIFHLGLDSSPYGQSSAIWMDGTLRPCIYEDGGWPITPAATAFCGVGSSVAEAAIRAIEYLNVVWGESFFAHGEDGELRYEDMDDIFVHPEKDARIAERENIAKKCLIRVFPPERWTIGDIWSEAMRIHLLIHYECMQAGVEPQTFWLPPVCKEPGKKKNKPVYSGPMAKIDFAKKVKMDNLRSFDIWAQLNKVEMVRVNAKAWCIRLDTLNPEIRKLFE